MLDIQSIVSSLVAASLLLLVYIHIYFKERMRGANLIFATVSVLTFGGGTFLCIWSPSNLEQADVMSIFILTTGTASGFIYAAYKFDANKENKICIGSKPMSKGEINIPEMKGEKASTTKNNHIDSAGNQNVFIHADNFIANAHVSSTIVDVKSTEINCNQEQSSTQNNINITTSNNNSKNETVNNTYNNSYNETGERTNSDNVCDNTSNDEAHTTQSAHTEPSSTDKKDYFNSKTEEEKDFIRKYIKYEFRNRPVIEAFTRYFEMYRGSNDKDTFILQAFYCARLSLHLLTEEPSRSDFTRIWGDQYLGGKSAYSEAKKSLEKIELSKIKTIEKKIEGCLIDVEREMGFERDFD